MITLLDKATLLFLYITPAPVVDYAEEGIARCLNRLVRAGLVEFKGEAMCDARSYEVTERGKVLCEALRNIPLPVATWTIPPDQTESRG